MYIIWGDQFDLLSIITPRNLVSFTSEIRLPFIRRSFMLRGKHFGVNNMKLVLSTFKDSLLAFTQEYILSISTFISLTISFKFLPLQKRIGIVNKEDWQKELRGRRQIVYVSCLHWPLMYDVYTGLIWIMFMLASSSYWPLIYHVHIGLLCTLFILASYISRLHWYLLYRLNIGIGVSCLHFQVLECGTWYHHPRRLQCVLSRNLIIFKVATLHYRCRHNLKLYLR